jgi:hypothetical protein
MCEQWCHTEHYRQYSPVAAAFEERQLREAAPVAGLHGAVNLGLWFGRVRQRRLVQEWEQQREAAEQRLAEEEQRRKLKAEVEAAEQRRQRLLQREANKTDEERQLERERQLQRQRDEEEVARRAAEWQRQQEEDRQRDEEERQQRVQREHAVAESRRQQKEERRRRQELERRRARPRAPAAAGATGGHSASTLRPVGSRCPAGAGAQAQCCHTAAAASGVDLAPGAAILIVTFCAIMAASLLGCKPPSEQPAGLAAAAGLPADLRMSIWEGIILGVSCMLAMHVVSLLINVATPARCSLQVSTPVAELSARGFTAERGGALPAAACTASLPAILCAPVRTNNACSVACPCCRRCGTYWQRLQARGRQQLSSGIAASSSSGKS